jgi:hypothetical protein
MVLGGVAGVGGCKYVSRVFVKSQFPPLLRLEIKFSLRTCVKNT